MKVSKKVIGNLEKCYSVAPLTYKGKKHMLVAAEKVNQCRLYDLEGNQEEVIWEGPGGTMSMVQVPGSDGQFLATHKFYSPNDSKEAKIILAYPEDGEWKVRTLAELPFVHRFDIISRNGVNYVIACTLKSGHEYKEDWRSPGKIQVCILPEDLSSVDEVLRSYVAANEGVFECIPPESEEGTWEMKQILDEASSDMAFVDFDNDGEDYILSANREIDEIALYKVEK